MIFLTETITVTNKIQNKLPSYTKLLYDITNKLPNKKKHQNVNLLPRK